MKEAEDEDKDGDKEEDGEKDEEDDDEDEDDGGDDADADAVREDAEDAEDEDHDKAQEEEYDGGDQEATNNGNHLLASLFTNQEAIQKQSTQNDDALSTLTNYSQIENQKDQLKTIFELNFIRRISTMKSKNRSQNTKQTCFQKIQSQIISKLEINDEPNNLIELAS